MSIRSDFTEFGFTSQKRIAVLASLVARLAKTNNGITFDPVAQSEATPEGFAVSLPGFEVRLDPSRLESEIAQYLEQFWPQLTSRPGRHFGLWRKSQTDEWFADVSVLYPTRFQAILAAHRFGQQAIWDLKNSEVIQIRVLAASAQESGTDYRTLPTPRLLPLAQSLGTAADSRSWCASWRLPHLARWNGFSPAWFARRSQDSLRHSLFQGDLP